MIGLWYLYIIRTLQSPEQTFSLTIRGQNALQRLQFFIFSKISGHKIFFWPTFQDFSNSNNNSNTFHLKENRGTFRNVPFTSFFWDGCDFLTFKYERTKAQNSKIKLAKVSQARMWEREAFHQDLFSSKIHTLLTITRMFFPLDSPFPLGFTDLVCVLLFKIIFCLDSFYLPDISHLHIFLDYSSLALPYVFDAYDSVNEAKPHESNHKKRFQESNHNGGL